LVWLTIVTMTAGLEKIVSADPKLGFLSHAAVVTGSLASGRLPAGVQSVGDAHRLIVNDYIDAAVAAFFLISVVVILVASAHEWFTILSGRKAPRTTEVPYEAAPRAA
ncbi:MAG: carbon starvation protein A, partial [Gemmatimonadaceae bacterium]